MKIRFDFVSNSSSSSFIVSTKEKLETIIIDILNKLKTNDKEIDTSNSCVLNYMLRYNTLLFLGYFETKECFVGNIITNKTEFLDHYKNWKTFPLLKWNENISNFDIIDEHPDIEILRKDVKEEITKELVKRITGYCYIFDGEPEICRINQDTIETTQLLKDIGFDIKFDELGYDFDTIKTEIDNGNQLFKIRFRDNGEGFDHQSLFCDRNIISITKEDIEKITNWKLIGGDN